MFISWDANLFASAGVSHWLQVSEHIIIFKWSFGHFTIKTILNSIAHSLTVGLNIELHFDHFCVDCLLKLLLRFFIISKKKILCFQLVSMIKLTERVRPDIVIYMRV